MDNKAISRMFEEIADMLEISGDKYSRFEIGRIAPQALL